VLLAVLASSVWLMVATDRGSTRGGASGASPVDGRDPILERTPSARPMKPRPTTASAFLKRRSTGSTPWKTFARHQGTALSADEIRRIASYQQSFNAR